MTKLKTTSKPPLRSPCGKFKSNRGIPFTEQTLHDHLYNCPQCKRDHVWVNPHDFYGNEGEPIDDFDTSDMPDGAYFALRAELNGDLDD
jgi:hypothetical protein